MGTVKELDLSRDEQIVSLGIVCQFGDGCHPYPDENTIPFFTVNYLNELISDNEGEILEKLTDEGKKAFVSLKEKVKDYE